MSTDRPLPFPTPISRGDSAAEATALANDLRAEFWVAALEDEEPDYELLERFTDGTLPEEEAEALALRAEWDPNLARELAEMALLRDRLVAGPRSARAASSKVRIWRTAALAAALLLAVLGLDRSLEQRSAERPDANVAGISDTRASSQPLFSDGFENGSAASWAN
jgi:hypothetical protein